MQRQGPSPPAPSPAGAGEGKNPLSNSWPYHPNPSFPAGQEGLSKSPGLWRRADGWSSPPASSGFRRGTAMKAPYPASPRPAASQPAFRRAYTSRARTQARPGPAVGHNLTPFSTGGSHASAAPTQSAFGAARHGGPVSCGRRDTGFMGDPPTPAGAPHRASGHGMLNSTLRPGPNPPCPYENQEGLACGPARGVRSHAGGGIRGSRAARPRRRMRVLRGRARHAEAMGEPGCPGHVDDRLRTNQRAPCPYENHISPRREVSPRRRRPPTHGEGRGEASPPFRWAFRPGKQKGGGNCFPPRGAGAPMSGAPYTLAWSNLRAESPRRTGRGRGSWTAGHG